MRLKIISSDSGYHYEDEAEIDVGDYGGEASEEEPSNDDGLGSETEQAGPMLAPASTNAYVFVANPERNTVTQLKSLH